jgi:hypothetical protein
MKTIFFIFIFFICFFFLEVTPIQGYGFGFTPKSLNFDTTKNQTISQFIIYNPNPFPIELKPIDNNHLSLIHPSSLDLATPLNLTIAPNSRKTFLLKQKQPVTKAIQGNLNLYLCRLNSCKSGSIFSFIIKYNLHAEKYLFKKNEILIMGSDSKLKVAKNSNLSNSSSNPSKLGGIIIFLSIIGSGLFFYFKSN